MAHRPERWKEFDQDELEAIKSALGTEALFMRTRGYAAEQVALILKLEDHLDEYMASIAVADGPDDADDDADNPEEYQPDNPATRFGV